MHLLHQYTFQKHVKYGGNLHFLNSLARNENMSGAPRRLHEKVADVDFTADDGTPMQLCVTRYPQPIYWGRFSMRTLRASIFSEQVHKDQLYELCKRELQYQRGILANSPWLQRGSVDWPPAHSHEWFERAIPLQVESNGSGGVHASAMQPPAIYLERLRKCRIETQAARARCTV